MQIFWIGAFGAFGVVLRYWIDLQVSQRFAGSFPLSTFAINCLGSFLIGLLFAIGSQREFMSREFSMALTVGLLGGFTTFSAFSLQTLQLIERKQLGTALAYGIGSPVCGIVFALLGVCLGRIVVGLR